MKHKIRKIKPLMVNILINTRKPFGLFYSRDKDVYIGIDNSTGRVWVEEFTNLKQCKKWLLDPSMTAPLLEEAA